MKQTKNNIVIIFIMASLLFVGCSSIKNIEESVENKKNITTENSENNNITFDELQKIAVNKLGKDSDTDGASHYVKYTADTITVDIDAQETAPDISEISEKDANNDMERIEFLSQYYEFVKNEYDDFYDYILINDVTKDDFYKLVVKYKDFIHSSYIEGKSKQALTTYFYITIALSKEETYISNMIDIKNDNLGKVEKKSKINEQNDIRLDVRSVSDTNIKNVYNKIKFD